jgi:hypothetical protein
MTLVLGLVENRMFLMFLAGLTLKGITEFFLLQRFSRIFNLEWPRSAFWIYQLVYVPYIVLAGILALVGIFRWK